MFSEYQLSENDYFSHTLASAYRATDQFLHDEKFHDKVPTEAAEFLNQILNQIRAIQMTQRGWLRIGGLTTDAVARKSSYTQDGILKEAEETQKKTLAFTFLTVRQLQSQLKIFQEKHKNLLPDSLVEHLQDCFKDVLANIDNIAKIEVKEREVTLGKKLQQSNETKVDQKKTVLQIDSVEIRPTVIEILISAKKELEKGDESKSDKGVECIQALEKLINSLTDEFARWKKKNSGISNSHSIVMSDIDFLRTVYTEVSEFKKEFMNNYPFGFADKIQFDRDVFQQIYDIIKSYANVSDYDLRLMYEDTKPEPNKLYLRKVDEHIACTIMTPEGDIVRDIKLTETSAPESFALDELNQVKHLILEEAGRALSRDLVQLQPKETLMSSTPKLGHEALPLQAYLKLFISKEPGGVGGRYTPFMQNYDPLYGNETGVCFGHVMMWSTAIKTAASNIKQSPENTPQHQLPLPRLDVDVLTLQQNQTKLEASKNVFKKFSEFEPLIDNIFKTLSDPRKICYLNFFRDTMSDAHAMGIRVIPSNNTNDPKQQEIEFFEPNLGTLVFDKNSEEAKKWLTHYLYYSTHHDLKELPNGSIELREIFTLPPDLSVVPASIPSFTPSKLAESKIAGASARDIYRQLGANPQSSIPEVKPAPKTQERVEVDTQKTSDKQSVQSKQEIQEVKEGSFSLKSK